MKKFFFAFTFLPLFVLAQNKPVYSILGTVSGFPDGTNVSFFNRSTNSLDSITEIKNGSFTIKGEHLDEPDFRFLVLDKQKPIIIILLENDQVTISGTKGALDKLDISGSPLNDDYKKLSKELAPFNSVFETGNFTPENVELISKACETYVKQNPSSFVSLLAISQMFQLSHDALRAEALVKKVDKSQLETNLGKNLTSTINIEKSSSIGAHIKPFTQNDLNGKAVNITDFKGKYVLIDFWASWCQPCRIENPNVAANFNRFKDKNFTVLGVSLDQSKNVWESAVKADNLTWTQVSDLKGWQNEVSSMFHVSSIPANILIDPNGVIIAKNIRGPQLGATLEKIFGKK